MNTGKRFRDALRSGRSVYGTLLTSGSPKLFDTVASLGLDFVFLCNEHVLYNPDTLGWMCRAYKAAGINPVVRILSPDPYLATQALDAGAGAILVPYIEKEEEVRQLIGAVKYRPLKGKKLDDLLSGREIPDETLKSYLTTHNQNNTLLINIESREGVKNLESLLSFQTPDGPGIDGIVVGPHDLSVSFDMPEKYQSPEFLELSSEIIKKARGLGVAAGGHNGSRASLDLQKAWAKAGASIILHSSDMFLFADKIQDDLNHIKAIKGENPFFSGSSTAI